MKFEPISLDMRLMIKKYNAQWKLQCSEYAFGNLFIWGSNGKVKICEEDDTLFIELNYGKYPCMFAPLTLDEDKFKYAIKKAEEHLKSKDAPIAFRGVSGKIRGAFDKVDEYELVERRDNHDYIYSVERLITLTGKKLSAKRNHINKFMANNEGRFEYVKLGKESLEDCVKIYDEWIKDKDENVFGIKAEREAIIRAVSNMDELEFRVGGIKIDGELKAFSAGEVLDETMGLVHLEKADSEQQGLFQFINQQFLKNEMSELHLVNREEDMGIEGLRKAKLSYYPEYLIEKFEAFHR